MTFLIFKNSNKVINNFLNSSIIRRIFFNKTQKSLLYLYYLLILSILKSCHIRFFQLGTGIVQSYCKTIFVFGRDFKHRIHHNGFYDGTQTASSQLVFNSFVYNILKHRIFKVSFTPSISNNLTYCLIMEFFGSVRMARNAVRSKGFK